MWYHGSDMKISPGRLVVGNWKMNPQTVAMAIKLARDVRKRLTHVDGVEVVLAPPAVYLQAVKGVQNGARPFKLGAQNVHPEKLGAHTGEMSIAMFKSLGVGHIILGHSERRVDGETDDMINRKLLAVIGEDLTAILCVGERTRDQAAQYLTFIEKEIRAACAGLSRAKLDRLVIAYEPIWAIGTGDTATPEDVHEMRLFIEKVLADVYGRTYAEKVRILYGGSVTGKNATPIMAEGGVDGFLVGGASLHASEFCTIVASAKHSYES